MTNNWWIRHEWRNDLVFDGFRHLRSSINNNFITLFSSFNHSYHIKLWLAKTNILRNILSHIRITKRRLQCNHDHHWPLEHDAGKLTRNVKDIRRLLPPSCHMYHGYVTYRVLLLEYCQLVLVKIKHFFAQLNFEMNSTAIR